MNKIRLSWLICSFEKPGDAETVWTGDLINFGYSYAPFRRKPVFTDFKSDYIAEVQRNFYKKLKTYSYF